MQNCYSQFNNNNSTNNNDDNNNENEWIWSSHFLRCLSCSEKGLKNSGMNGDPSRDLCDASTVLHQLSCSVNWEQVVMWVVYKPVDVETDDDNTRICIWNAEWKWKKKCDNPIHSFSLRSSKYTSVYIIITYLHIDGLIIHQHTKDQGWNPRSGLSHCYQYSTKNVMINC